MEEKQDGRWLATIAVAAVSLMLAAGCGDDDGVDSAGAGSAAETTETTATGNGSEPSAQQESSSLATSPLSREQYIQRANAICKREKAGYIQKVGMHLQKLNAEGVPQEAQTASALQEVLIPIVEAQIDEIQRLGAPAGDKAELEAALAAQEAAIEDVSGVEQLTEDESPYEYFAEGTKRLSAYGLPACRFA